MNEFKLNAFYNKILHWKQIPSIYPTLNYSRKCLPKKNNTKSTDKSK